MELLHNSMQDEAVSDVEYCLEPEDDEQDRHRWAPYDAQVNQKELNKRHKYHRFVVTHSYDSHTVPTWNPDDPDRRPDNSDQNEYPLFYYVCRPAVLSREQAFSIQNTHYLIF